MRRRFFRRIFGQRWQSESVFSRFKRCLGSELRAVLWENQVCEAHLRSIVHNLLLLALRLWLGFQQSRISDFRLNQIGQSGPDFHIKL
jgi:hypothetical protein